MKDVFDLTYNQILEKLDRPPHQVTIFDKRIVRSTYLFYLYVWDMLDSESKRIYELPLYITNINKVDTYEELLERVDPDYVTVVLRKFEVSPNQIFYYRKPFSLNDVLNFIKTKEAKKYIKNNPVFSLELIS